MHSRRRSREVRSGDDGDGGDNREAIAKPLQLADATSASLPKNARFTRLWEGRACRDRGFAIASRDNGDAGSRLYGEPPPRRLYRSHHCRRDGGSPYCRPSLANVKTTSSQRIILLEEIAKPLFAFATGRFGVWEIGKKPQKASGPPPQSRAAKAIRVGLPHEGLQLAHIDPHSHISTFPHFHNSTFPHFHISTFPQFHNSTIFPRAFRIFLVRTEMFGIFQLPRGIEMTSHPFCRFRPLPGFSSDV